MDGIMRCSRYSFGPNRLHYCGPDANAEMKDLIENENYDLHLKHLLQQFKTLHPYLLHIAQANNIRDPFDARVVEAYWLGNELLETVKQRALHRLLIEDLHINDMIGNKDFSWLEEKIGQGAVPHHSFHVFNIWRRTGNADVAHTISSMDECRVSSGVVTSVNGPKITVSTEPLVYVGGKFALGALTEKVLTRQLEAEYDIEQIKPGEIVSIHWGVPCEIITKRQQAILKKYTLNSIAFANQTI